MAVTYPNYLKTDSELQSAGLSPISAAERKFFDVAKKSLDESYRLFHGKSLQGHRHGGGIHDREIDFLIAHPEYGLLVFEVKGGEIRVDGPSGEWTSRDRHGVVHSIKNPFAQVKEACYDLADLLREDQVLREFDYSTWYAVAFPDVDVEDGLGVGTPLEILLDRNDLLQKNFPSSIGAIFNYYKRKGQKTLGQRGIKALTRRIAPSWCLRSHLASDFLEEEQQFLELTIQQYSVLEFLESKSRAMIAGCAGSGKTLLALEKARRLSSQGLKVLFTCYNKNLAEWLSTQCDSGGIAISHFHSLAVTVTKEAGKPIPWITDLDIEEDDYWTNYVPEALLNVASELPRDERYDAIIVDEGQDFLSTYWEPLQMLLKDPDDGILYIFYDDSQRLYSLDSFPLPEPAGRLNRNLRSTNEIGTIVSEYYRGAGKIHPAGPKSGREIELVDLEKFDSPEDALLSVLTRLTKEQVSTKDIVLLTTHGDGKSQWKHRSEIGDFELVRSRKIKGNRILTSTIHSFKGLESPVVILSELEKPEDEEDILLLYVAISRAKNQLIVLGDLPLPQLP